MMKFRTGVARVLVSTDVLARGIDVQQVTLVINFELPIDQEQYLHRIDRLGRYGRKGVAINICSSVEMEEIHRIQEFYRTAIGELPVDFATIIQQANDSSEEKRP
jgi:superfamily II DNA/RNA helicase